ncbi:hypothetical protein V8F06_006072 [Rhypophila decipiens]
MQCFTKLAIPISGYMYTFPSSATLLVATGAGILPVTASASAAPAPDGSDVHPADYPESWSNHVAAIADSINPPNNEPVEFNRTAAAEELEWYYMTQDSIPVCGFPCIMAAIQDKTNCSSVGRLGLKLPCVCEEDNYNSVASVISPFPIRDERSKCLLRLCSYGETGNEPDDVIPALKALCQKVVPAWSIIERPMWSTSSTIRTTWTGTGTGDPFPAATTAADDDSQDVNSSTPETTSTSTSASSTAATVAVDQDEQAPTPSATGSVVNSEPESRGARSHHFGLYADFTSTGVLAMLIAAGVGAAAAGAIIL